MNTRYKILTYFVDLLKLIEASMTAARLFIQLPASVVSKLNTFLHPFLQHTSFFL